MERLVETCHFCLIFYIIHFVCQAAFTVQTIFNLKILRYADDDADVELFPDAIKVIKGICSVADNSWCKIEESALVLLKLIQRKFCQLSHYANLFIFLRPERHSFAFQRASELHIVGMIHPCGSNSWIWFARWKLSFRTAVRESTLK